MRHEQHRRVAFAALPVDDRGDCLLVGEIEAGERLIAQEQGGVVGKGLADAQPLLLAPGEEADGAVGVCLGAHVAQQPVDALAVAAAAHRQSEARAVHTELDEVARTKARVGRQRAGLGDVADRRVAAAHRPTGDGDRAGAERLQPEDRAQQRRLA